MASILIRAEGTSPTAIPLENSTDCGKQSVLIKDTTDEKEFKETYGVDSLTYCKTTNPVYFSTNSG